MKITSFSHLGACKEGDDWSTWKVMNHQDDATERLGYNLVAYFHGDIYRRVGDSDVTEGYADGTSIS
jgi:hypothetical protein